MEETVNDNNYSNTLNEPIKASFVLLLAEGC